MTYLFKNRFLQLLMAVCLFGACSADLHEQAENGFNTKPLESVSSSEKLYELRRGDILVRPNLNVLPGSAFVPNGSGFGHAALVVEGYAHQHIDSLLAGVQIVESIAKDVPRGFQIRQISGYTQHHLTILNNVNFGPQFAGNRYRLRGNFSEQQIDSILAFALAQRNDLSSWNALKSFPIGGNLQDSTRANWADNNSWYCSLLVWQSVYYVTNIDLDPSGGYMVYPNDLIACPVFDEAAEGETGRIRF